MKLVPADSIVYLDVSGRPAPQGSKRAFRHRTTGKVVTQEMSTYVKPWREDVRAAAEKWVARNPDLYPLPGALSVDMVFSVARPAAHYGTGRNARTLKPSAPRHPASMPDLSKLARSTEDALTSAGLWSDDARVVEYGLLAKRYVVAEIDPLDVFSRRSPGAVILVRQLEVAS